MSFVIFPVEGKQSLIALGVGTQGIAPDEMILAKPGHSRKVQAICTWLNKLHKKQVAWAKNDAVRIDADIKGLYKMFPDYKTVLDRYGFVLYGIFAPTENEELTEKGLKALLDLSFSERGVEVLKEFKEENDSSQTEYLSHLFESIDERELDSRIKDRRFVIIEGPPVHLLIRMML
jgi:5-methylcytosine-specific restriction protein B